MAAHTETPTHDEIRKVRVHECTMRGHSWNIISTVSEGPVALVCGNCGDRRRVVK